MTGNVLDFKKARIAKDAEKPAKVERVSKDAVTQRLMTNTEIFDTVYEEIIYKWQDSAAKNSLNKYIRSRIPPHVRGLKHSDYVGDLNVISVIEQKLGMKVIVFYPECTPTNSHGWLVGFHRGKDVFSAPPHMATEAYARSLNIVLYLAFEAQMKKLMR